VEPIMVRNIIVTMIKDFFMKSEIDEIPKKWFRIMGSDCDIFMSEIINFEDETIDELYLDDINLLYLTFRKYASKKYISHLHNDVNGYF
jgi:hypothetical protein